MKSRKNGQNPKPPSLPSVLDEPADLFLEPEGLYVELAINGKQLENATASQASFQDCRLSNVVLTGAGLTKARFSNIEAISCDISNANFEQAKISRAALSSCKLLGAQFGEATLADVVFTDSVLNMAHLYGAKLKSVHFSKCTMRGADFRSCSMENVAFTDCDLAGAEFYGAKFTGVKFGGSDISAIKINIEDLKGAIIDRSQLLQLSELLAESVGITVLE